MRNSLGLYNNTGPPQFMCASGVQDESKLCRSSAFEPAHPSHGPAQNPAQPGTLLQSCQRHRQPNVQKPYLFTRTLLAAAPTFTFPSESREKRPSCCFPYLFTWFYLTIKVADGLWLQFEPLFVFFLMEASGKKKKLLNRLHDHGS